MSVTYQQLLHDVALRLSALVGTQVTTINAAYDTAVLTSVNFKSADWPFNSFRDAILMAEAQFADVAASVVDEAGIGNHTWRPSMAGVTAALADGAVIPSTDNTGNRIIGAYGEVTDGTDGLLLSKRPLELVRRIKAEPWRLYQLYYYALTGRRISHTRATAIINVCVYNRTTQLAAFAAGNMLLPDTAEAGISALAISLMTKDGAFVEQAKQYHETAAAALQLVAAGSVPKAA